MFYYSFHFLITELNSTSPSTSEFDELTNDLDSDELSNDNEEDEEDADEDILYMRGSSFTIHLEPAVVNFTDNFTSNEESGNEIPQGVQLRPTSQVSFYFRLLIIINYSRIATPVKRNLFQSNKPINCDYYRINIYFNSIIFIFSIH